MSDEQTIKNKLYSYFDNKFSLRKSTKGFYRLDCPICGGKNTAGINVDSFTFKCFKECTDSSNIFGAIAEIENLDGFREVKEYLSINENIDAVFKARKEKRTTKIRQLELPEEFLPIDYTDSIMGKAAQNYITKRKFKINNLALKGVGYCVEGRYSGYIIFPFYEAGKLVFFQGRRFAGNGPKMQNPNEEEFGIGKSALLYNKDALAIYPEVNLVESITNCLTLDDNTVAGLGKTFSDRQVDMIIKSPCKSFNIILDPDAFDEALTLASKLIMHKEVRVVKLPEPFDVNDIGYKGTIKYIENSPKLTYSGLLKLKLNEATQLTYN